jgi:histidyl-tRNA synthetase
MRVQKYIFSIMGEVAERYGYMEYSASILEDTALYKAKTGEEIVNEQTYSFIDRGEREVTIRPEMTPTVARMVARKRQELTFPLRWYSIPNLFRYERPQRGRLREHWQLNVDVFGIDSLEADAEIITMSAGIMKTFGAKNQDFQIKINNRKLVNFVLHEYLRLDADQAHKISKLVDRKAKMEASEFEMQAGVILGNKLSPLMEFLNAPDMAALSSLLPGNNGMSELAELLNLLTRHGVDNIVFDPSLMRGFDYYTGTVFEVFDTNPENNRSLFGGGRYDDLVGLFDVEKVGGVGFGMGDVTIKDFLDTHGLLPTLVAETQLYICRVDHTFNTFATDLAADLRGQGLNVAVDYTDRKIAAQIKTADRQAIPYIICIGEDETKANKFKLKNLKEHSEKEITREKLAAELKTA